MPDPNPEPNAILDFLRRNSAPAVDMWRNAETGLTNATQQFNERASGDLQRYFGVNAAPDTVSLLTALMGGVKAPTRIANPIKAYHGSPHDFNEFDLSKIGTGEGAQAYGHGLYFAENENVARQYRDNLAGTGLQAFGPERMASELLASANGDYAKAAALGREEAGKHLALRPQLTKSDPNYPDASAVYNKAADLLQSGNFKPPGRMYEVALHATPEQFINYDETPGGQTDFVKQAMRKVDPLMGTWGEMPEGAKALGEAGIPGIRYLDQQSRLTPDKPPTHNYVVWSPEIIEMLRKYGLIAAPTAGAIANAISQPQQSQQQ